MVDSDIVYAKIAIIQRCLHRIQSVTNLDPERLENIDVQDIFVLNLQRASQAAIDLAAHVVASEGLGMPSDLKEHFLLLRDAGILKPEVADRMKKMVGFRNIAVHNYRNPAADVLKSILANNLKDLEDFYSAVILAFNLSE